ncbi:hypothetical protein TI39_contig5839g00028 [Zymoseptoria brevis]|uniref:BTB domain-containing protein n=1 Tax=Zymoseptoria brevis TaxID=1047168 RepID=A0A0F4G5K1_9PEZI|nr:hypothetical protein TI39_contig5839g00028 [Zymoseptoria brevis]
MKDTKADLCDQFKSYYNSEVFSDFTIKCGDRKWKVHKFVLAVHSDVFKRCCHSTTKESSEGVLDLSKHDELKVETLVHYLYHFNYDYANPEPELDIHVDQGCFHIDMAVIADRYFIAGLNNLANRKFRRSIINTVLDDAGLAMLATTAYEIPQATEKHIRGVLVGNIVKARILESSPAGEVAKAMRNNGDFALDVAL